MGSAFSNALNGSSRGNNHGPFFVEGVQGGGVLAPLSAEEVERVAGHPNHCPLDKVCHGEAVPWPGLQEHVGMVRRRTYGGVARVLPEFEGSQRWWSGGKWRTMRPLRTSCGCGG